VGINLSAIVIIMAISCAGTPTRLNGFNRYSMASVSCIGEVVSVSRDDPVIINISLVHILAAPITPSSVSLNAPTCSSTSPGVKNMFKTTVNIIMKNIPRNPRSKYTGGTWENLMMTHSAKTVRP